VSDRLPVDEQAAGPARDAARERARLYNNAGLAQSVVPRGVGELLKRNRAERAKSRAAWRARPRAEKAIIVGLTSVQFICLGVLMAGATTGDATLAVAGGAAWAVVAIAVAAVAATAEVRRAKRRRDGRARPH
jgi:hypothetical protein